MSTPLTTEPIRVKPAGSYRWRGFSLFLAGILLLCLQAMKYRVENWWAIFIVLPGVALIGLGRMWGKRGNGRYPLSARLAYGAAGITLVVASMFLLNLNWAVWWPLMIIAPGGALLITAGGSGQNPTAVAWTHTTRWLAVAVLGLGGTFLAHNLGLIHLNQFGDFRWWGVWIAVAACGAFVSGLRLLLRLGYPSLSVIGLWLLAFFSGATAVIELLGIPWSSIYGVTAVICIAGGTLLLLNGLRPANE
ncbi:MAG: hypothetical protein H6659_11030 [Ardenticatenaceae bacterium]|nr:hypothetical protein [Ardenticatenaceae bacterium]MCB8987600.1 hypothetical protein [Ardenticatenaceae bacterium]